MSIKKLAVFVSGGGTNLQAIIDQVKNSYINGKIVLVISDKKDCFALKRAEKEGIETRILDLKNKDLEYSRIKEELKDKNIDLVVLAGYMRVIPKDFIEEFKGRIINLHPALLPNFGGLGMYGDNVHKKVLETAQKVSGATVHYVDSGVDTGEIIGQAIIPVYNDDSVDSLRMRVHSVEHKLLVRVIKDLCK